MLTHFGSENRNGSTFVDQFTPAYAQRLADLLLPAMRVGAAPRIRPADERERSIETATEQQTLIIRMLGEAPRIIVDGGAGSGKTHVATRVARRAANRDNRVLLTMFNIYLEAHLQQVMHDSGVTVRRIHAEMMRISGLTAPADADSTWWNETLPLATLSRIEEGDLAPPYDFVVIDEAQDLAPKLTLDVLDKLVVGGLGYGAVWAVRDF